LDGPTNKNNFRLGFKKTFSMFQNFWLNNLMLFFAPSLLIVTGAICFGAIRFYGEYGLLSQILVAASLPFLGFVKCIGDMCLAFELGTALGFVVSFVFYLVATLVFLVRGSRYYKMCLFGLMLTIGQ
jgi:hypothetical protein